MRAVPIVALLAAPASAEPEGELHEEATRDGAHVDVGASLQMRTDGAAVGVGVGTRLVRGDYALAVGLTRWQTIDDDGSQGGWELGVRAVRSFRLGERTRAYVMAGAGYELVERDVEDEVRSFGRSGVMVGAGVAWRSGWVQLTAERKTWLDKPPDVGEADELRIMVVLGFAF